MDEWMRPVIDFVRDHHVWAAPIVFVLAFGESLAFISLFVPAWGALVAIGMMVSVSEISFWPVWLAGAIGAGLGDWVSYWVGHRFKHNIYDMWPLYKYPHLVKQAEKFVSYWGVVGIFIGRFSGPLRATVPLVAGIFEMPYLKFQLANFSSAFVWSAMLLLFGDSITKIGSLIWGG
ncbi:MAG TPA: DedA family protein [Xanthobacteraceae bacterium]|nr:DedA family protein [Xanthobacteraceae bacterium]